MENQWLKLQINLLISVDLRTYQNASNGWNLTGIVGFPIIFNNLTPKSCSFQQFNPSKRVEIIGKLPPKLPVI